MRSCFRTSASAWLSATQGALGQDHVVERALGLDRLDQLPGGGAEEEIANGIGHAGR